MKANNQAAPIDQTKVAGEEQQQDTAATPEQAEADLTAGFEKVRAHDAPTQEKPALDGDQAAAPAENAVAATAATIDGAAPASDQPAATPGSDKPALVAGMTEAQVLAVVDTKVGDEVRKVFSKIGEMNRTVQELKAAVAAGGGNARTRKITAEALKRVEEELPGLGAALAADLDALYSSPEAAAGAENAAAAAAAAGKPFDPEVYFAEKLSPALIALESRISEAADSRAQKALVTYMHPDFDVVVKTPEFDTWLKTLSEARRNEVVNSTEAIVSGKAVTEFKDWDKAEKAKLKRSKTRLENALVPDGGGGAGEQSNNGEEADLAAGFNKVAKKRVA